MLQAFAIFAPSKIVVEPGIGIGAITPLTHGEIVHHKNHSISIAIGGQLDSQIEESDSIKKLLATYEEQRTINLDRHDGTFVLCLFDRINRTLLLGTDRIGLCPCYYFHDGRRFAFASEVKALLPYWPISRKPDYNSWGNLLTFGFLLGNETLFQNIHAIPPGSLLKVKGSSIDVKRYWNYDYIDINYNRSWESLLEEGGAVLTKAIERHSRGIDRIVVPLSGGYDSRCICGLLSQQSKARIETVTGLNHINGFMEPPIAAEVARRLNLPNTYVTPPADLFRTYFVETIFLTDGQETGESIWAMPFLTNLDANAVCFDGLAGDVLFRETFITKGTWQVANGSEKQFARAVRGRIARRSEETLEFFVPDFRNEIMDRHQVILEEVQRMAPGPNRSIAFHLGNRTRRVVTLGTFNMQYRRCRVCCPFLDNGVIAYALSVPPEIKFRKPFYFYEEILRRILPDLMEIPSTNPPKNRRPIPSFRIISGFPVSAGKLPPPGLRDGITYALELLHALEVPEVIQKARLQESLQWALEHKTIPSLGVLPCFRYLLWHELFVKRTDPRGLLPRGEFLLTNHNYGPSRASAGEPDNFCGRLKLS